MARKISRGNNSWKYDVIAIIAIVIVIAIFIYFIFVSFTLSHNTGLGSPIPCIALSGYQCTAPILYNNQFTAEIGQATGATWTSANVIFVVSGSSNPTTFPNGSGCYDAPSGGILNTGQTFLFTVTGYDKNGTCIPFNIANSSSEKGTLWVAYGLSGSSNIIFSEIVIVNITAS